MCRNEEARLSDSACTEPVNRCTDTLTADTITTAARNRQAGRPEGQVRGTHPPSVKDGELGRRRLVFRDSELTVWSGRDDQLTLAALWEVTHSRLDLYHQIATKQARRSFFAARTAAAVGFAVLIGLAIAAIRVHSTVGAITAGTLGAVSAALAGFIGRTFVRSRESAASHLRAYFDQPLEFSRYLATERLLGGLTSEQRAGIIAALIQDVLVPNSHSEFGREASNG